MKEVIFEGNYLDIEDDHFYVARDEDGEVYSYRDKPVIDSVGTSWYSLDWCFHSVFKKPPEDTPDWRDSLVEYP